MTRREFGEYEWIRTDSGLELGSLEKVDLHELGPTEHAVLLSAGLDVANRELVLASRKLSRMETELSEIATQLAEAEKQLALAKADNESLVQELAGLRRLVDEATHLFHGASSPATTDQLDLAGGLGPTKSRRDL